MCYSAMVRQSRKSYRLYYGLHDQADDRESFNYRAFPHGEFPVVVQTDTERRIKLMNYSLIPAWSKTRKPKFSTYNARLETLCEKPTWRESIKTQRCLVGITSFFESCYEGTHAGNIVEFRAKNENLWTAAGIWSEWIDNETGEVLDSFAIINTEPSKFIKEVGHDRSPVFLPQSAFEFWLQPSSRNCKDTVKYLEEVNQPLEEAEVVIERPLKAGWQSRS
jgi:putative SOS response-associated peptidase YedK